MRKYLFLLLILICGGLGYAQTPYLGSVYYVDDATAYIDTSSSELEFTDGVTGSLKLSELVTTSEFPIYSSSPAAGHILIYDNGDSRYENKAVSGDITLSAAGATAIAGSSIVKEDFDDDDWGDVSVSSNVVSIDADAVDEATLKAVDAAVDEDFLTYESTTGDFEWHSVADVSASIAADIAEGELADSIIVSADIKDSDIAEVDLKAVDAAADEDFLTYESTTGDFEWHSVADVSAAIAADIAEGELANDIIVEADLKAVDAAADEDIFTYESTTGDFEWHAPSEIITAGTNISWSSTTLNVDDAFVVNDADDILDGKLTVNDSLHSGNGTADFADMGDDAAADIYSTDDIEADGVIETAQYFQSANATMFLQGNSGTINGVTTYYQLGDATTYWQIEIDRDGGNHTRLRASPDMYLRSAATISFEPNNTTATGSMTSSVFDWDEDITFGDASTDVMTCTGRLVVRSVTDAGPMTATAGTTAEIVFNTSDTKFYGCTVGGSPATWAAFH